MLWLSITVLVLLGLDVWNHSRIKDKTQNLWAIAFEGLLAVTFFLLWLF